MGAVADNTAGRQPGESGETEALAGRAGVEPPGAAEPTGSHRPSDSGFRVTWGAPSGNSVLTPELAKAENSQGLKTSRPQVRFAHADGMQVPLLWRGKVLGWESP